MRSAKRVQGAVQAPKWCSPQWAQSLPTSHDVSLSFSHEHSVSKLRFLRVYMMGQEEMKAGGMPVGRRRCPLPLLLQRSHTWVRHWRNLVSKLWEIHNEITRSTMHSAWQKWSPVWGFLPPQSRGSLFSCQTHLLVSLRGQMPTQWWGARGHRGHGREPAARQ